MQLSENPSLSPIAKLFYEPLAKVPKNFLLLIPSRQGRQGRGNQSFARDSSLSSLTNKKKHYYSQHCQRSKAYCG
jgi:hypothetical protein